MNDESLVLSVDFSERKLFYRVVKRAFDILVSGIALLLIWPILLIIGILVKIDSKGPAILKQQRIGMHGEPITIYKFRSMVLNADEILFKLLEENKELAKEYKINKKLKEDPRITKVGHVIRKLSLDELPQILSIFKGDMSVIGPRPYLYREVKDMGNYYYDIVKMKPGLTGYWQVNGRSNTTFEHRLKLDSKYLKIRGFKEDIKIFIKTFIIVFKKEGAE